MPKRKKSSKLKKPNGTSKIGKPRARLRGGGEYKCPICKKGFSRRSTVKDPHFPSCVKKYGNPSNLPWNADESCRVKRGTVGKREIGVQRQSLESEEDEEQQSGETAEAKNGIGNTKSRGDAHDYLVLMKKSHLPPSTYYESESEEQDDNENMENLALVCDRAASNSNLDQIDPDEPRPLPNGSVLENYAHNSYDGRLLSSMIMNQLVNVPIAASRIQAGKGYPEAFKMWEMWYNLLPDNAPCQLHAPSPTFSQKEQQQAVVWMAQDVYTALLKQSVNLMDQLEIVAVWRDITSDIGDDRGVASIHDFLIKALGEEGPLMLGQISP